MADGYQAWVEVLPDFSKFDAAAKTSMVSTLGAAGNAGGAAAGKGIGSGILGGIKGIAGPLVGAVAALGLANLIADGVSRGIEYSFKAVDLASNLSESTNAVSVAFGDLGDEILKLSEQAPARLNTTRNAFNQLATRFAGFATKIAGDGGDVVGVVDRLTQRGADFASVFNLEVSEALELFQSGLAGETEPLRKYTIDLSAAAVEQYAYANGIAAIGEELTDNQKIQARYGALLAQTIKYEGDLANTRSGYANQQREFAVALEEAQTKFGEAVLPTATDLLQFANTELIPILEDALAEAGPALSKAIEDALPAIKETLSTLADFLPEAIGAAATVAQIASDSFQADFAEPDGIVGFFGEEGNNARIRDIWQEYIDGGYDYTRAFEAYFQILDLLWDGHADTVENTSVELKLIWSRTAVDVLAELDRATQAFIAQGEHWGDGLAEGFRNRRETVREAAALLAGEAIQRSAGVMGIRSPSTVAREQGQYWGEGMELGLLDSVQSVSAAARAVARGVTSNGLPPGVAGVSAPSGSAGTSGLEVTLVNPDPYVLMSQLKQELGGKLVGA